MAGIYCLIRSIRLAISSFRFLQFECVIEMKEMLIVSHTCRRRGTKRMETYCCGEDERAFININSKQ